MKKIAVVKGGVVRDVFVTANPDTILLREGESLIETTARVRIGDKAPMKEKEAEKKKRTLLPASVLLPTEGPTKTFSEKITEAKWKIAVATGAAAAGGTALLHFFGGQ